MVFYNGELIKFTGSTIALPSGTVPVIQINVATTNLTYYDGSVNPSRADKTAVLTAAASVTDTLHFPYSSMVPYQKAFGEHGREAAWNTLDVSTDASLGGVVGTIYYRKNVLTNTLHLRGALTANNAQNFADSPFPGAYTCGSLPAGYTPGNTCYFTAFNSVSILTADDAGVAWLQEIHINVSTAGAITANWLKPATGVTAYGVQFNTLLPLD
jgi:hypothetical protein